MDAPRDLVASDVQTDSATLTWTPPLATVTGYILNLQTADGHERVSGELSKLYPQSGGRIKK